MLSKSLTFGCNHWVCLSGAPLFFFTPTFLPSLTPPPQPSTLTPPICLSLFMPAAWVGVLQYADCRGKERGCDRESKRRRKARDNQATRTWWYSLFCIHCKFFHQKKAWSSLLIISDLNKLEYLKRIRVFLVTGELNKAPLSVLWCVQKKAECGDFPAAVRLLWMTVEMTDRTDTTSSLPLCTHLYAEI